MTPNRLALALVPALCAALALPVAGSAQASRKCKNKKEESGCKLPANARYTGQQATSSFRTGAVATIQPGTIALSLGGGTIGRGTGCPASNLTRVIGRLSRSARVGRTYDVNLASQISTATNRFKGTLRIRTAGSATLKGRYTVTDRTAGRTLCSFSPTVTLKRTT